MTYCDVCGTNAKGVRQYTDRLGNTYPACPPCLRDVRNEDRAVLKADAAEKTNATSTKIGIQLKNGGKTHLAYISDKGTAIPLCGCPNANNGVLSHGIHRNVEDVTCLSGLRRLFESGYKIPTSTYYRD